MFANQVFNSLMRTYEKNVKKKCNSQLNKPKQKKKKSKNNRIASMTKHNLITKCVCDIFYCATMSMSYPFSNKKKSILCGLWSYGQHF